MSRHVQDESGYYTYPQNVILTPSIDGKFVNVIANTPNKLIMTEGLGECIDSIKYDKKKWVNVDKISGIIECIYSIEKSTNMIRIGEKMISSHEHLINQVKEHANNLMENTHSHLFYSCIAKKMQIHETRSSQRRYLNESYTMTIAYSLYLSSSIQYEKLEKVFLLPLDTFFNSNKESTYVLLLRTIACHLCNKHNNVFKNNEIKNNNVVALYLDKINIATMLSYTNKACTFRILANNAEEMANSIQVFLLTTLHSKKHRINL